MTHLQHAQPVLFAHHLLAHVQRAARDVDRLRDWDRRAAVSPARLRSAGRLVAGARPGGGRAPSSGFDGAARQLDRRASATATSPPSSAFVPAHDRRHLSRLGEEVVLWATRSSAGSSSTTPTSTGSSIMPQKKNPDVAELARGKAGRLIGNLTGLLTTLKGLPLAYNRDLQEDKEPLFDSVDTLLLVLPAVAGLVATLRFDTERLEALAPAGFALATDLADWLVRRGRAVPRRARDRRRPGAVLRGAGTRAAPSSPTTSWPAIVAAPDPRRPRGALRAGRARLRKAHGGTAPAGCAEQLAALGSPTRTRPGRAADLRWRPQSERLPTRPGRSRGPALRGPSRARSTEVAPTCSARVVTDARAVSRCG